MSRWFITGTDTGVGKTCVATGLLHGFAGRGDTTAAYKPVATGCLPSGDGLRNEDALALMAAMTEPADYDAVNPVALAPAIAPHLAAAEVGRTLSARQLAESAAELPPATQLVVEGAGGWRVPISATETLADLAVALGAGVILVVGIRLGCLNHALLTAEAIERDGVPLCGWVANIIDGDVQRADDQIASLQGRLAAPLLGTVPWLPRPEPARVAECLILPG